MMILFTARIYWTISYNYWHITVSRDFKETVPMGDDLEFSSSAKATVTSNDRQNPGLEIHCKRK